MSNTENKCILCNKECKLTDSRPHPNNQSKYYIHNRCRIKKNILDKNSSKTGIVRNDNGNSIRPSSSSFDLTIDAIKKKEDSLTSNLAEKRSLELEKRINNPSDASTNADQFFFDLKAGIAKPNEKRQYLHHRKLCDVVSRFDDNGFKEESAGRAYDHTGKDLNTLGDESDSERHDELESDIKKIDKVQRIEYVDNSRSKRSAVDQDDTPRQKKLYRRQSHIKVDQDNPCWFCLSSPNVEKHLIIAIGEYCYLTLAKGGLIDDHLLVIPIEHFQATIDQNNSNEVLEELERFKSSLVDFFKRESKGVVFFERNFRSVHWQLQVVPIPFERIEGIEDKIKTVSLKQFSGFNYIDIPKSCSLRDMIPPKAPYMFWEIEPLGKRFVSQIAVKNNFFPLQLGRTTLADPSILDKKENIDWKKCIKSKDEYVVLANKIKTQYNEFDFT